MEKQNKDKVVGVRFSTEEYAKVESACNAAGLPLATYIRFVVLRDIKQSVPPSQPSPPSPPALSDLSDQLSIAASKGNLKDFVAIIGKLYKAMNEDSNKTKK